MRKIARAAAKFVVAFIVMTIVCTIAWELFVDEKLYDCRDGGFCDYLGPGDWVHAKDHQPIEVVPKIVPHGDMSFPDTIKEGWTIGRLWELWLSFFIASVVVSTALAAVPWPSLRKAAGKIRT